MSKEYGIMATENAATYLSVQNLAAITDLSPPTVRLRCVGVPTRARKNRQGVEYEAKAALKLLMTSPIVPIEDLQHHRTRKEKCRADLLEIKLAKIREGGFSRADTEKARVSFAQAIQSKLLSLLGAAARELASLNKEEEVERVLASRINEVFAELEKERVDVPPVRTKVSE